MNNNHYTGFPCAFQTAAANFSVINGSQTGIVVNYGEALELVDKFIDSYDIKEKTHILKQLQKYTVSVYSYTLKQLNEMGIIQLINNEFYILDNDYYDAKEQGLLREQIFSFLYC